MSLYLNSFNWILDQNWLKQNYMDEVGGGWCSVNQRGLSCDVVRNKSREWVMSSGLIVRRVMVDGVNHEINISNQYSPHLVTSPPPPHLHLLLNTQHRLNKTTARPGLLFWSEGAQINYWLLTKAGLFCLDPTNTDWLICWFFVSEENH